MFPFRQSSQFHRKCERQSNVHWDQVVNKSAGCLRRILKSGLLDSDFGMEMEISPKKVAGDESVISQVDSV
jgi:hypothetical protein